MIDKLLLLGMGCIQRSLLELMNKKKHPLLKTKNIIVICPEDIPKYIYDIIPQLQHIKKYITEDNMTNLLNPLMDNNTLCIDLTVDTDSIQIMNLSRKNKCLYINTSIEEYKKDDITNPEKKTLYYQNIQLDKEMKKIKSNISTLESGGCNPGLISNLVMEGIYNYCKKYKPNCIKFINKNKWSYVASKCVNMIHCAETDTQLTNLKCKKNYMYNSWSPAGFISEALSPSFLSSPKPPTPEYVKSKYNKNMYINPNKHSMDCFTETFIITPNNKVEKIKGRMITHNEVVSLSDLFSTKNYTPTITYVYNSCKISQDCLDLMKKNNYKEPKNLIGLYQNDIINKDSYDSMGACIYFKDGRVFWCGSVLTNNETMKLLGKNCKSNCTQLQVSICVLSNIEYLLKNKNDGIITNEDLPFKKQIDYCKPYWGLYVCREITEDINKII